MTDAISALGLEEGKHNIGQFEVEIRNGKAFVAGTDTLCGSIATMNRCVQLFKTATGKNLLNICFQIHISFTFKDVQRNMP